MEANSTNRGFGRPFDLHLLSNHFLEVYQFQIQSFDVGLGELFLVELRFEYFEAAFHFALVVWARFLVSFELELVGLESLHVPGGLFRHLRNCFGRVDLPRSSVGGFLAETGQVDQMFPFGLVRVNVERLRNIREQKVRLFQLFVQVRIVQQSLSSRVHQNKEGLQLGLFDHFERKVLVEVVALEFDVCFVFEGLH